MLGGEESCLLTFSSFDGAEVEFEIVIFAAGKRSRFNRIGFVSFVGVDGFDDLNNRLVIDGAEHGNGISIKEFAKIKSNKIFFCSSFFLHYLLLFVSFSCSIKSSKSLSLSFVRFFDETTTRFDVPCTTFRFGILADSAITTFRFTTTRDGVVLVSSEGSVVTVCSFSIGVGGTGRATVSVLIVGGGTGRATVSILIAGGGISGGTGGGGVGGLEGTICGLGTDSGGFVTGVVGLITSLLTRFVVDARNK